MDFEAREGRVVVFDMDGTLTEVVEGGYTKFSNAHAAGLAELLGIPVSEVIDGYAAARAVIELNPGRYGWYIGGLCVAPALVDHFVAVQVIAGEFLRMRGEDPSLWDDRLNKLYAEHYLKLDTSFRPEMMGVFEELHRKGVPFFIVSSSDPSKIRVRFNELGSEADWIHPLIHGFARKMRVTGTTNTVKIPGCPRPIWAERGHYQEVLEKILNAHGFLWKDLTVVGDILELDGLVPILNGARFLLLAGPNTPEYEQRYLWSDPRRGRVISSLIDALDDRS